MKTIEEIRAFYEACKKARSLFGKKFDPYRKATDRVSLLGPCPGCCAECSNDTMLKWIFPELKEEVGG